MFTMLLECPMKELKTHKYYNSAYVMTVIVGQSGNLKYVMDDNLEQEISRGLLIFFLSLLGGSLLLFLVFSAIFERRLQIRVTKPISQLSKQIRNPKDFVNERNSAVDFPHGRKTSHRRNHSDTTMLRSGTTRPSEPASTRHTARSTMIKGRGSSMGKTRVRDLVGSSYSSQVEQDERLNKMKSINEVEALRNIFHSFFEKGIQQNDTDDKVLISMQSPNHSMNPFFRYEKEKEEDAELERSKSVNVSAVYAYATNLEGMFEHLNELNERRELNPEWGHAYDTRNSMGGTRPNIELEKISENSRDETGLNDRQESCENVLVDDGFGLQKP